jgi:hypothetical protein
MKAGMQHGLRPTVPKVYLLILNVFQQVLSNCTMVGARAAASFYCS